MIRMAINGFGRIGRSVFKVAFERSGIEIVSINDLIDAKTLAHLLKYDSVYGPYKYNVQSDQEGLIVNGKKIKVYNQKDPSNLSWDEDKIDVVIESTGIFTTEQGAGEHIRVGAKKVILSAPSKEGEMLTLVLGVNNDQYKDQKSVSNASCTTNCITPVVAVIHEALTIKKAMMSTVHAYTSDQRLHDTAHKDLRRARAAGVNIVPTTTGAAIAATEAFPPLKGKFDGMAIRVPVIDGSLSDIVMLVEKKTTPEEVNKILEDASQKPIFKNILRVTKDPIVSTDIIGDPHSAIVDLSLTKVVDGDFVKVVAWYDNEWGYSNRMVETALLISQNQ